MHSFCDDYVCRSVVFIGILDALLYNYLRIIKEILASYYSFFGVDVHNCYRKASIDGDAYETRW